MLANDVLIDGFNRVLEVAEQTLTGINDDLLIRQLTDKTNTIDWLFWHLARIEDAQIAEAAKQEQVWKHGWSEKFQLDLPIEDTGYAHQAADVIKVNAPAELLLNYYRAVHLVTIDYIGSLNEADYLKIVEERWDPPVRLKVRLVSILADALQHAGQAAILKGIFEAS